MPRQSDAAFVGERSFSKSWGLQASVSFTPFSLPLHFFFLFSSQFCRRTRAETLATQANTNHARHLSQHFNHDSYKQELKTSQHKEWQKIQIKVSFSSILIHATIQFSLSCNLLTLPIYHCGLSILIHRRKSTKPPQHSKPKSHGLSSIL